MELTNTQALKRIFTHRDGMMQTDREVYTVSADVDALTVVDEGVKMQFSIMEDGESVMVHLTAGEIAWGERNFGWFALDPDGNLRPVMPPEFGRSSTEPGREYFVANHAKIQSLIDKHLAELSAAAKSLPPVLSEISVADDASSIHAAPLMTNDPEPGLIGAGKVLVQDGSLAEEAYENRLRLEVLLTHDNNGALTNAERSELNALADILIEQLPGKSREDFLREVKDQVLREERDLGF
jgi:hypothetical protein